MIIGRMSIDPKTVLYTTVSQDRGRFMLTVRIMKDGASIEIDDYFDSESTALRWQEQLDGFCYKDTKAKDKSISDALTSQEVDGELDGYEESYARIGF